MLRLETRVLGLLPLLAFVFGCLEYGPHRGPERGALSMTLHVLATLAVIFAWFWLDARRRGYRASIALRVAMLGLTVAALPYYLFRSRGFGGGMKGLAWSVLVFGTTMAAYRVGSLFA